MQNRLIGIVGRYVQPEIHACPMRLHNGTAVTLSNLSILSCHAEHVCSFLWDRPRDAQPSHLGNKRGSLQSQSRRRAARSTDDPAGKIDEKHLKQRGGLAPLLRSAK